MSLTPQQIQLLKSPAKKVQTSHRQTKKAIDGKAKIQTKQQAFTAIFKDSAGKYIVFGALCIAALLFDFIISQQTMEWLARLPEPDIPVEIIALIFTLLDGGIAISASGCFVENELDKALAKKKWGKVLWSMAIVKIIMFVTFVHFITPETGEYSWFMTFLMMGFVALTYTVLDFAGEGLGYIVGNGWYGVLDFMNGDPDSLRAKTSENTKKLDLDIAKYQIDKDAAYSFFEIPVNGNSANKYSHT